MGNVESASDNMYNFDESMLGNPINGDMSEGNVSFKLKKNNRLYSLCIIDANRFLF